MYVDSTPDIVIQLAAVVRGISANRENPGKFLYNNLMIGVQLTEISRKNIIEKFVSIGTIYFYSKYTPVQFYEEDLWNGYTEGTNAIYENQK